MTGAGGGRAEGAGQPSSAGAAVVDATRAAAAPGAGTATKIATAFDGFPADSPVWIFGCDRELADDETRALVGEVDRFRAGWAAHGTPLRSARAWLLNRFLAVAVDARSAPPSGCSIDALVRVLRSLETRLGARLLGSAAVWYRDRSGRVRRVARPEFRVLATRGEVGAATIVFDNSITALGDLRDGRWEGPAGERWHAALLPAARG